MILERDRISWEAIDSKREYGGGETDNKIVFMEEDDKDMVNKLK